MQIERQRVNLGEVFSFQPQAGNEDWLGSKVQAIELIGEGSLSGGLPLAIKVPFLPFESRNRGTVVHGLEVFSDGKLLRVRRLVEVNQARLWGVALPFSWTAFWPGVEDEIQRLRLHLMRPTGRLEQEPDFEAIKRGEVRFEWRSLFAPEEIESIRLRFISAD